MIKIDRPNITIDDFDEVLFLIQNEWKRELKNKGKGIFVNSHEALGCLEEEYHELKEEIIRDKKGNNTHLIEDEILDMIVILVHELASIRRRK